MPIRNPIAHLARRLARARAFAALNCWVAVTACAPRASVLREAVIDDLRAGWEDGRGTFEHAPFDRVLQRAARPDAGRVDYAVLHGGRPNGALPADLRFYLDSLATAPLRDLPKQEQIALLINAYNAFTLALVLEHYPRITSIKDVPDPWGSMRWVLGGHTLSLDGIEHGILRPLFADPRVHFALNCASIGCPPLRDRAFVADQLDAQLDVAVRDTLSRPGWARRDGERLLLTSILRWFGGDFTGTGPGQGATIPGWVAEHGPQELRDFVRASAGGASEIAWIDYDWRLNDVERGTR